MFVESSSKEEWSKRGDYFFANKLWHVAAICYRKAEDGKDSIIYMKIRGTFNIGKFYQGND